MNDRSKPRTLFFTHTDLATRIARIASTLRSEVPVPASRIARMEGVCSKTIYRTITFMRRDLGYVIESVEATVGTSAGYRLISGPTPGRLPQYPTLSLAFANDQVAQESAREQVPAIVAIQRAIQALQVQVNSAVRHADEIIPSDAVWVRRFRRWLIDIDESLDFAIATKPGLAGCAPSRDGESAALKEVA